MNGSTPSVARPQFRAVEYSAKPRLLKAALATNSAPLNMKLAATKWQKNAISSRASPVALKMSLISPLASASSATRGGKKRPVTRSSLPSSA